MNSSRLLNKFLIIMILKMASNINALPIHGDFSYESLCQQYFRSSGDARSQLTVVKEILRHAYEDLQKYENVDYINNELTLQRFENIRADLEADFFLSKKLAKKVANQYKAAIEYVKNNPKKVAAAAATIAATALLVKNRVKLAAAGKSFANSIYAKLPKLPSFKTPDLKTKLSDLRTKLANAGNSIKKTSIAKRCANFGSNLKKESSNLYNTWRNSSSINPKQ